MVSTVLARFTRDKPFVNHILILLVHLQHRGQKLRSPRIQRRVKLGKDILLGRIRNLSVRLDSVARFDDTRNRSTPSLLESSLLLLGEARLGFPQTLLESPLVVSHLRD